MAERTFNPNSPACGEWETLLADALDGQLKPEDETAFTAHMAVCPACTALFEASRRGREWLEFLSPEPEVPSGLFDRILAQTGPGQAADYGVVAASGNIVPLIPAWQRPGFVGHIRRYSEPHLMMTAAMAFFSIALTLNLTGVRLSALRLSDLRPSTVLSFPSVARSFMERRLTMASTPIVRYYDHSRLAYELRELRRETQGEGQGEELTSPQKPQDAVPGESKQTPEHKDGGLPVESPEQSSNPALRPAVRPAVEPNLNNSDFLETSLRFQDRPAHSGGSAKEIRERSTVWTA
ncbi:MAG: anti-sigma factor [Terracidiphilus sp.]|jgi:hypothetical protein